MTTRSRSYLAVFALALLATPSAAQDWLIVGGYSIRASGPGVGESTGRAPADVGGAGVMLAGGGRYAARFTEVYDRFTGQFFRIYEGSIVDVDPVRPRVFVQHACNFSTNECSLSRWDFLTGGFTRLGSAWLQAGPHVTRYAVDADVLFIDQTQPRSPTPTRAVVAVNATTGALVSARLALPPGGGWLSLYGGWDVSPDGTRLFAGAASGLVAIDVASGSVLAASSTPGLVLAWNTALGALIVSGDGSVTAFDHALHPLGSAPVPATYCGLQVEVSPHTGRIFVLHGGGFATNYAFIGTPHTLLTFDPATARWGEHDLVQRAGLFPTQCHEMRVLTAPGPPRNLRSTASGHDVSLAWENVGAASGFVLDVGFAPGRTDLQVYLGPDSHTAFANVPSGTYYLRLRGGNEFGGGRPSPEIQVHVP